jgi:salicylate biosynthesis isochorismate synthase
MKDDFAKYSALRTKPATHAWNPTVLRDRVGSMHEAGLPRIENLDPWLAAHLLADEFDEVFLWASDCGGLRFAALGALERVGFDDLSAAVADVASTGVLPRPLADRLPLGLFVAGQTDERPGAFGQGETDTSARCWIPRVLLLQQGSATQVVCVERRQGDRPARRLEEAASRVGQDLARLRLDGAMPRVAESNVEDRKAWDTRVARGLEAIHDERLEKVVVSRRMEITPSEGVFSPWASAWQVQNADGRIRFAISMDGAHSMFIGATPETLLRIENGRLMTHALAGTLAGEVSVEQFLASPKLREEHIYVTDGLISTLAPFTERMTAGAMIVRHSGTVSHLETPLEGRLRGNAGAVDILQALHPTPAIGGWPRREAMDALCDIEPYSRGWFAAPLGWLAANGNAHAAIAIRSQWVSPQRSVMLAGAGIVRESDPRLEWQETEVKFDNMRCVLRSRLDVL